VDLAKKATKKRARVFRILIVDSEPTLKEVAKKHLVRLGFDVELCGDSESALKMIGLNRPDVVCVDLNLPRESGYEVCEAIRKKPELRDLAIVLMSDRSSPEDRAHAEEAGANAYLTKPFSMNQLTAQLRSLLGGGHT
jgi:two-component system chemotaxis response regulator CheY